MKNNFRFIFPRLIGATVIVGIASFIMFTLFKLMVGILIIGGVATLAMRMAGRRRSELGAGRYGQHAQGGIGPMSGHNQWADPITVNANSAQKQTIVPIN